jgi:site-specific DNA recombinase
MKGALNMNVIEKIRARKKIVRAVAYTRFSSDNQREESIDAQIRAIKEYAARNDAVLVGEYIDKAKSAMTDNRPEFLRMIADSKLGGFDIVLVHKLDRFARNRHDSIGYRMELKRHGVSLVSVLEYLDDESPESLILESVLEAMAEYYSRNLAREVNKGMKENALNGMHTGGHVRLEPGLKKQAESVLEQLGIPVSNAVNIFLKQVVMQRGIPFDVKFPAKKPVGVNGLTESELNAELEKGFTDLAHGNTKPAANIF